MMLMMLQDSKPSRFYDMTLQNTYKSDDIKTKNNQISTNLIDNAIIDVQKELREIVDNTIEEEIPFLQNVDNNNSEKYTMCRTLLKTPNILKLNKSSEETDGQKFRSDKILNWVLDEHINKIDAIMHEDSFQYITYENSTPRIDSLKKLLEMARELKENNTSVLSISKARQIIKNQNIKDSRTIKKYEKCMRKYSINRNQESIAFGNLNMTGFYEGVLDLIKKWEYSKNTDNDENILQMSSNRGTGVAPTIQNAINEANTQSKAMHDFRIMYPSKEIFQNAIKAGKVSQPINKGIFEDAIHTTEKITTNIVIYPKKSRHYHSMYTKSNTLQCKRGKTTFRSYYVNQ